MDGYRLHTERCFEHFFDGGGDAAPATTVVPGFGFDVVCAGADELAFGGLRDLDIDGAATFETDILLVVPVDGFLRVNLLSHNKSSFKSTLVNN